MRFLVFFNTNESLHSELDLHDDGVNLRGGGLPANTQTESSLCVELTHSVTFQDTCRERGTR